MQFPLYCMTVPAQSFFDSHNATLRGGLGIRIIVHVAPYYTLLLQVYDFTFKVRYHIELNLNAL